MTNIHTINDNETSVLRIIKSTKELKYISTKSKIGLRPHWDGIPDKDKAKRENRIQSFIVASNGINDSNLTRSTIFIPKSHKHIYLFYTYWIEYHPKYLKKCKDKKKLVKGKISNKNCPDCYQKINASCPQWLWDLNINDFNNHLKQLYEYSISNSNNTDENIISWWNRLDDFEKNSILEGNTPVKFDVVATNFSGGELILFMPGVIHWVLNPKKSDKLYTKLFLEIYTKNDEKIDNSGYTVDDGGFKQDARDFELDKYNNNKDKLDSLELNINEFSFTENLSNSNINKITNELRDNGIVAFNLLNSNGNKELLRDICNYLSILLDFPENLNLIDKNVMKAVVNKGQLAKNLNISDIHLYRHPNASMLRKNMSSVFPSSSGNTGLGAYSNIAKKDSLLYNKLLSTLNPIFNTYFKKNIKLSCISIGYQGGK